MASIPDEDRGASLCSVGMWETNACVRCLRASYRPIHLSIHPSIHQTPSDVEFDPQAVSIIRQNWIDKQLKKR